MIELKSGVYIDDEIFSEVWEIAKKRPILANPDNSDDELLVAVISWILTELVEKLKSPPPTNSEASTRARHLRTQKEIEKIQRKVCSLREDLLAEKDPFANEIKKIVDTVELTIAKLPKLKRRKTGPSDNAPVLRATEAICCSLLDKSDKIGCMAAAREFIDIALTSADKEAMAETTFRNHYWKPAIRTAEASKPDRVSRAFDKATKEGLNTVEVDGYEYAICNSSKNLLKCFHDEYKSAVRVLSMDLHFLKEKITNGDFDGAISLLNKIIDNP